MSLLHGLRRAASRGVTGLVLWSAIACAGGDAPSGSSGGGTTPTAPTPPAPPPTGTLSISAQGLPEGVTSEVVLVGPSPATTERIVSGSQTLGSIAAGRYTVNVRPVRGAPGRFAGFPASFEVTVVANGPAATATASYRPVPSVMAVAITGLPANTAAAVAVTIPNATAPTAVPQNSTLEATQNPSGQNTPDLWKLAAQDVTSGGARYAPTPRTLDTLVSFGDTARVAVRYQVATGSIAIAITGLPAGVAGSVELLAPDNSRRAITGTSTVTGLEPGRYRVVSRAVTQAPLTFLPSRDTLPVDVVASLTAAPATVQYVAQAGRVAITVAGLPTSTAAALTLTGPAGITRTVTTSTTLDSLPVGSYTLRASTVTTSTDRYAPTPPSQSLTVATGAMTAATVTYASIPTAVEVTVTGLPAGADAAITLTPPIGDAIPVTATRRVAPATPGRWRLAANPVTTPTARYTPSPTARDTTVSPGDTLRLPVTYALATGSLAVTITGLPVGVSGAVTVTGPSAFSETVSASRTLTLLSPATYTVVASAVVSGGITYTPTPASQSAIVAASLTAATATVTYVAQNQGTLAVTITGLPAATSATVTVTGPNSFSRTLTASTTLTALTLGSYTVTAATVTSGSSSYAPTPATQTVTVAAPPSAASAAVTYALQGGGGSSGAFDIDLRIVGSVSTAVSTAFSSAVARWKQVITGHLHTAALNAAAGSCASWVPAVNETINDLVIYARVSAIDGVGNVAGRAGPCYVSSGTKLTILGHMEFDEADVTTLTADGRFTAVVLHEMGHVLGIGSLWDYQRTLLNGAGTADPFFSGTAARAQFATINTVTYAGTPVPVENTGGAGTADSHWRETVLGRELMTGWINTGSNPLSRLTVGSLQDLGYTVSLAAADAFSITAPLLGGFGTPPLYLGPDVPVDAPLFEVAPDGTVRRVARPVGPLRRSTAPPTRRH